MNAMFKRSFLFLAAIAAVAWPGNYHKAAAQSAAELPTQFDWAQEHWSGDTRPYRAMRAAIDKAIASGKKPYALAQKYEVAVQKKPLDPKVLFPWAYATYKGYYSNTKARDGLASREDSRKLYRAIQALARPSAPQPHDYVRLRFLMNAMSFPHREFKELGRRLLRNNPTDTEVECWQFGVLFQSPSDAQDRRDVLAIAQDLRNRYPKVPGYYATLGSAYMTIWQATKSPAHANMAIAAYRKYIQLAPPKARYRRFAQSWIDYIQKRM